MARFWLARRRHRWSFDSGAAAALVQASSRARTSDVRDRAHHQGQGRELHGRHAVVALPYPRRRRARRRPSRAWRPAMRTAFFDTLTALAERDERLFLLTGDLGF